MNPPDPLSPLLRSWSHQPAPAPDFNDGVWARLKNAPAAHHADVLPFEPSVWSRWTLSLAAAAAIMLSAVVGTGAALAYENKAQNQRMATAYARSIDPLQMSGAMTAPHRH